MLLKPKLLAGIATLAGIALLTVVSSTYAGEPKLATYRVTLTNLTHGQPFSPPVAATHNASLHMFRVGALATDQLAAIAQDGNEVPMFNLFNGDDKVTQAVDVGRPLTASGTVVGSFTDTATFEIQGAPGDKFSLATMLICTNDGFLGLDAVKLPRHGSEAFSLNGYDAGREHNTEASQDIVDPCSGLNPSHPLAGDPNGNNDATVATTPAEPIQHHAGIQGGRALSPSFHGWSDPVARVTITRLGQ